MDPKMERKMEPRGAWWAEPQLPRCLSLNAPLLCSCFGVMELWKLCGKDPIFVSVKFSQCEGYFRHKLLSPIRWRNVKNSCQDILGLSFTDNQSLNNMKEISLDKYFI